MATRGGALRRTPGSAVGTERHSADFYDQRDEFVVLREGDRLLVPCAGGPSTSRLETYLPRLEVAERGGTYVLDDAGPRAGWRYVFVPDRH
jgi:hypothetical protein